MWISMDFVDGLDAARLLADRYPAGMPIEEVVRIVSAVASALDYAHKQGLLHRDVKPANIMMTHLDDEGEQRILLTDFGIARNVNDISGLTKTNTTVGAVAYSAVLSFPAIPRCAGGFGVAVCDALPVLRADRQAVEEGRRRRHRLIRVVGGEHHPVHAYLKHYFSHPNNNTR